MIKNIICDTVNIEEMQFEFCSDQGTTDAIFILRQLQENYLAKHRKMYMAFVNLENLQRYYSGLFMLVYWNH